ncbi:MAG: HNH endonuclease [Parvularculaceae bacterium]|nr:HNH endonuclease [Parvularculaceae bacterium]
MERSSLSKKLRFEVFKRDKFTCQYCGKSAPNVVLHVDHIKPVSKDGTNDILNLITSCEACNGGKSNIELSDDNILTKQQQQLSRLQERREQLELMLEWRRGLEDLDATTLDMIVGYIENKIPKFSVNENGRQKLSTLANRFDVGELLDAVDISAKTYLRYEQSGSLNKESVENFFGKIGGIIVNSKKSPIDKKLSYIVGIGRNRFSYFNMRQAMILLRAYVRALQENSYSEEAVLADLENEVITKTKELSNWSQWKSLIEGWTAQIENWKKSESQDDKNLAQATTRDLDVFVSDYFHELICIVPALHYLSEAFCMISEEVIKSVVVDIGAELIELYSRYERTKMENPVSKEIRCPSAKDCPSFDKLMSHFQANDDALKSKLSYLARTLLFDLNYEFVSLDEFEMHSSDFEYIAQKFDLMKITG